MVLLCAEKWIFGHLRKFPEKYQKIHAPEGARSQKGGPKRPAGAARGGAAPSGRLGASPSSGALPRLLFIPVTEKPRNRSRFPILVAEPLPPSVLLREG